jgi:hypothetical protein
VVEIRQQGNRDANRSDDVRRELAREILMNAETLEEIAAIIRESGFQDIEMLVCAGQKPGVGVECGGKRCAVLYRESARPQAIAHRLVSMLRRECAVEVMSEVDEMPAEWRALVHELGYGLVRDFYFLGMPLDEARERIEELR